MDIAILPGYYNKVASATNKGILFASSCTPICEANEELRIDKKEGVWKGFSLECLNKKLTFSQTGNRNSNSMLSAPTGVFPGNWSNITVGNTNGDFSINLDDVDSIGVFVQKATDSVSLNRPEILLTLKLTMVMPNSRGKTTVSEQITAKIQDRDVNNVIELK
jgi:hypothetical protein